MKKGGRLWGGRTARNSRREATGQKREPGEGLRVTSFGSLGCLKFEGEYHRGAGRIGGETNIANIYGVFEGVRKGEFTYSETSMVY